MSTQQRIEQAKKPKYAGSNDSSSLRELGDKYEFTESELTALLLSLQDEQIMKCRIKANQAGCTESVDRAISDTEYDYNPKQETA